MKKLKWFKNNYNDPDDIVILESNTTNKEKQNSSIYPSNEEFKNVECEILEKCDYIFKELAK